jgi:hypothetical protein
VPRRRAAPRDAHYDLSGNERVAPGASTPLGGLVGSLGRLLQLEGVRVFHQRRSGPLSSRVALLAPLGAIVNGSVDSVTPVLRYTVGGALMAATPPFALAEGLEEGRLRNALSALLTAFGPLQDDAPPSKSSDLMRMAQDLWSLVQGADERRIRGLCDDAKRITTAVARKLAGRARRRAGMFACGDFLTAVAQTAAELDLPVEVPLRGSQALRDLCRDPDVADLYDLALTHEYAEARWRRRK